MVEVLKVCFIHQIMDKNSILCTFKFIILYLIFLQILCSSCELFLLHKKKLLTSSRENDRTCIKLSYTMIFNQKLLYESRNIVEEIFYNNLHYVALLFKMVSMGFQWYSWNNTFHKDCSVQQSTTCLRRNLLHSPFIFTKSVYLSIADWIIVAWWK